MTSRGFLESSCICSISSAKQNGFFFFFFRLLGITLAVNTIKLDLFCKDIELSMSHHPQIKKHEKGA